MAFLPGVGTCSYNGFSFNGSLKSRVSARFVYDQAERTIAYVVYTLDLTSIITNSGSATDTPMDNLRNLLSKPGQCLQFTTTGLGTMNVNCSLNGALDVVWGPKPRLLEMEPIGSSQAWRVRWICEVAIPQCTGARYAIFPVAFNYELNYSVGEDGLTTRTYEGYVEIPMSRWPGFGGPPDTADRLREQINPPLIEGFRRKPGEFKLSSDRRVLNFTITDIEMTPDGMPQYCTNATGNHTIRTRVENTFFFDGELTATYTVSPKEPKTRAWEMFYLLMVDRLGVAQAAANQPIQGVFRLLSLELSEGLFKEALQMSFKANYCFFTSAENLLVGSGQWRPIPGTDWSQWASSIQNVLNSRGSAGLFYNKADDALLDLCTPRNPVMPTNFGPFHSLHTVPESGPFGNPDDPVNSWMGLRTVTLSAQLPGTIHMKTLPKAALPDPKVIDPPFGGVQVIPDTPPFRPPRYPGETPSVVLDDGTPLWFNYDQNDGNQGPILKPSAVSQISLTDLTPGQIVQQRTNPVYKTRLIGDAVRVGYPIPPPFLRIMNGAYCVPDGEPQFLQAVIGNWAGRPIYSAAWDIPYRLVGQADGPMSVPMNPLYLDAKYGGATR